MPDPSITKIGFGFRFRKVKTATVNNKTETKLIA